LAYTVGVLVQPVGWTEQVSKPSRCEKWVKSERLIVASPSFCKSTTEHTLEKMRGELQLPAPPKRPFTLCAALALANISAGGRESGSYLQTAFFGELDRDRISAGVDGLVHDLLHIHHGKEFRVSQHVNHVVSSST